MEGFVRFADTGPHEKYIGSFNFDPAVAGFGMGGVLLETTLAVEGADCVISGQVSDTNPFRGAYGKFGFVEVGPPMENFDAGENFEEPSGVTMINMVRQPSGPPPSKS